MNAEEAWLDESAVAKGQRGLCMLCQCVEEGK